MDALTLRHRRDLQALSARTVAALRILWRSFDPDNAATYPRFALPAAAVITRDAQAAADLGLAYYRALRVKRLGESPRHPTVPEPAPLAQIVASLGATGLAGTYIGVRNGYTREQAAARAFTRVARASQRHVVNGSRSAVLSASAEDSRSGGYIRAVAGTCDFCAGIAAEGKTTGEFHAHDGCHCVAEPSFNSKTKVNYKSLEGRVEDRVVAEMRKALDPVVKRFDSVLNGKGLKVELSDTLNAGQLASKSNNAILLNEDIWQDAAYLRRIDADLAETAGGIDLFAADSAAEQAVHEFGHIVDQFSLRGGGLRPLREEFAADLKTDMYFDMIRATSSYALEDYSEFRAELFLRYVKGELSEEAQTKLAKYLADFRQLDGA